MRQKIVVFTLGLMILFLIVDVAAAQEPKNGGFKLAENEYYAPLDVGFRTFWGNVYGRPDLPFTPELSKSKMNEYSDIRKNLYLRRAFLHFDGPYGKPKYFEYQSQSTFYKNQSHLATFGQYGKYAVQVRYTETPHLFSNTTRTVYGESAPGVYTIQPALRQALQTASSTGTAAQINNALPSFVANQLPSSLNFIFPNIERKAAIGLFNYDLTPDWSLLAYFGREQARGTRPIGAILNSSPSASGSSQPGTVANRQSPGSGAELPEPIDYVTKYIRAMSEYANNKWAFQAGYNGIFFNSKIDSMIFDAPFATADIPVQIIPPGNGCTPSGGALNCAIGSVPGRGQMALYPDNKAQFANFAGAFDAKRFHLMGSASNGWLRQNDPFLPYTINSAITGLAPLPARSLSGNKQTLAMNWTGITKVTRDFQVQAKYRQYDYNNNTAEFELTPIEGDTIGANSTATGQAAPSTADTQGRSNAGFNRKTLELSGDYFFTKHSVARIGYEADWFDRTNRDVAQSFEHSIFASVDYKPTRDFLLRVSGRHQNRDPEEYQDETASDPVTGAEISCTSTSTVFTEEQRCHRRFDEAARILDRGDVLVQYDLGQFSFSGAFQTIQIDFNRQGGTNSPTAMNFIPGRTRPYYLYGAINDVARSYSFDVNYDVSPSVSTFLEYAHENYYKRMISRNRTPTSGTETILTCAGCDTSNNDWESITRDVFDTYAVGLDVSAKKRFWVSPYYTLTAGIGNVLSRALGDPTITTGPNRFTLTGTTVPEDYPQTTTRIHEGAIVIKYKLSENFTPRFEYRLQQFDNQDYQTTPMTPYMGCIGAGTIVVSPPCVNVGANLAVKSPSPFYPGFVVGDTAAARYLFLGADQPSYRSHIIMATVEYRF